MIGESMNLLSACQAPAAGTLSNGCHSTMEFNKHLQSITDREEFLSSEILKITLLIYIYIIFLIGLAAAKIYGSSNVKNSYCINNERNDVKSIIIYQMILIQRRNYIFASSNMCLHEKYTHMMLLLQNSTCLK